MIKNRTTQLIFQTVYCTLGLVGCVAALGIFDDITMIRWDFYVHFTNISNYLCIGVMLAEFIQTAKKKLIVTVVFLNLRVMAFQNVQWIYFFAVDFNREMQMRAC